MIFQLELSSAGVFTVRQLTGPGEDQIFQQGSARIVVHGDNVGLTEVGSQGIVQYVYPTIFSDWQDETATPYPTKQDLLDDLNNRIFLSGTPTTIDPFFSNLTEGQVPKADAQNPSELIYSGATVDPVTGQWTFDKSIIVPQASLNISDTLSISEATLVALVRDKIQKTNIIYIGASVDESAGSSKLNFQHVPSVQNIVAQPIFNTMLTANPLVIPLLATLSNQTDVVTLKIGAPMTNFRATIVDDLTGIVLKYIPSKEAITTGVGLNLPAGDVRFNFNSDLPDNPGAGLFYLGFTPLRQQAGQAATLTIFADSVNILGEPGGLPYLENEIHFLEETTIPFTENITNIEDNYSRLNNEYSSLSGITGGIVVTYQATATVDTITQGQFTVGIAATSNPTLETNVGNVFSQNDLVQITGTVLNDGLYEVEDHTGTLLTVRGIGTIPTVEGFTGTNFITTKDSGTVTKVNVAIIRSGTNGDWELGKGSATGFVFSPVMDAFTYDPNSIKGDVFDMDNMIEGIVAKILTVAERNNIADNTINGVHVNADNEFASASGGQQTTSTPSHRVLTENPASSNQKEWMEVGTLLQSTPVQENVNWNSTQNNFALADLDSANVLRVTMSGGDQELTGIVAPSPAYAKQLTLTNADGSDTLKIQNNDGGSSAANRFRCPDNGEYQMKRNSAVNIVYDPTSSRWRIIDAPQ